MNDRLYKSERNFLERIADAIPGLAGYRRKESARDTDKRLREYIAKEIEHLRSKINDFKGGLLSNSRLDLLDDVDLVLRKLTRLADSIRYASYGYAGLFDQVKVREPELTKLYQFDVQLLDEIGQLKSAVEGLKTDDKPGLQITSLSDQINHFDDVYQERTQLFNRPEAEGEM